MPASHRPSPSDAPEIRPVEDPEPVPTPRWETSSTGTGPGGVERRQRPSDALFVEFLLQELREARDRTADAEALQARSGWRLVG